MKYTLFAESRIGGRPMNEDRILHACSGEALLLAVADGLGGHGHGEVAAEAALHSIRATFQRRARPRLDNPQGFLADALAGAHTAICAHARLRGLDDLPRTTCVACVVQDGLACWAHAGDSRLYVLRSGRVLTRTRDHSRVQSLVDTGRIPPAAARTHDARNTLTSCLGGASTPRFEFSEKLPLAAGDVLLLCTDGLWGPLPDDAPLAELSRGDALAGGRRLLDRVESTAGPGRDNLSLLLAVWQGAENAGTAAAPTPLWTAADFERTLNTTHDRLHAKEPR